MKNKLLVKSIVIIVVVSLQSAYAFYGTRPMGMGGAFTAISDDANAAYYNPAGMALNPGVDITGSTAITNRNQTIGENLAAMKMCLEVEMNPFAWILGIGAASMLAFQGAQFLSDQGVVKKGWGRDVDKSEKEESLSEKVKAKGSEKVRDVKKEAKQKAKQAAKKAAKETAKSAVSFGKEAAGAAKEGFLWGLRNPWYSHNYYRPSYWERRHHHKKYSPEGKAQFAIGLTWVFDKNSTLDQNTSWYSLSLASGYEERVAIGANLNIYDLEIPSVKTKGFGGSLDLGMIARPVDEVAFGITAKDLLTTDIHFDNGAVATYGMNVNAGIAITPLPQVTIAADLKNIFEQNNRSSAMHYGVEARPMGGVALRAGLHDNSKTAGIGIAVGPLVIDYAYLAGSFNRTQILGATWKI
ncbi:MAG: hypothetical protein HQ564_06885 [Candidatus Saganbacteria bacterium]|nr:hypothetical protein [Candidatus Saganbacteria bacterium]